ncbi:hypothetical protein DPMN_027207 [Dreissena polymorpha]|uniref:Uncharacterized protein n=1 Tax=Dreissena polymorpha TaxID=45954 RepID=A0A9D4LWK3_DREPO|nr:hypothetical protein DPMN_027207 [Dreissena polymorpha]
MHGRQRFLFHALNGKSSRENVISIYMYCKLRFLKIHIAVSTTTIKRIRYGEVYYNPLNISTNASMSSSVS